MNQEEEKLQLLGWFIVKGNTIEAFNTVLSQNQQYCKLCNKAVHSLPKEEFPQGRKKLYIDLIRTYTNYQDNDKKHEKDDLVSQSFDVDACLACLLRHDFFPKWALSYFRGFAKILQDVAILYSINLSKGNASLVQSCLEKPKLSSDFQDVLGSAIGGDGQSPCAEKLAQQIIQGNGARLKITAALREDYWISTGRYDPFFGIKKDSYLISDDDFDFLFEVNQIILKKEFQKRTPLPDLSKDLLLLCSRLSEAQQLDMLESLEDSCLACVMTGRDSIKCRVRVLAQNTDSRQVLSEIRSKFPDMKA